MPPNITALTGIHQEDVDDAPSLLQVRPEVEDLLGGRTLVAHNAPFDVGLPGPKQAGYAFLSGAGHPGTGDDSATSGPGTIV